MASVEMGEIESVLKEVDNYVSKNFEKMMRFWEEGRCYCPMCYDIAPRGYEGLECVCGRKYVAIDEVFLENWKKVYTAYRDVAKKVLEAFKKHARGDWKKNIKLESSEGNPHIRGPSIKVMFGPKTLPNLVIVYIDRAPIGGISLIFHSIRDLELFRSFVSELRDVAKTSPVRTRMVAEFSRTVLEPAKKVMEELGFKRAGGIGYICFVLE
jgi:hypothetical protein